MTSPATTMDEARQLAAARELLGWKLLTEADQALIEQHYPAYAALSEADRQEMRAVFRAQTDLGVEGRYDEIVAAIAATGDRFGIRGDFARLTADCIRFASGSSPSPRRQAPPVDEVKPGPVSEAVPATVEELQAQLDIVKQFIHERSDFVGVLAQYQGEDMSDYHRWTGHAEARRVLAQALGIEPEDAAVV